MWQTTLNELAAKYDRLKSEKSQLLRAAADGDDQTSQFSYFQIDKEPLGYFSHRVFFNWRNYLNIDGQCCLSNTDDLLSSLLFYDTVVCQLFPVPQQAFDKYHQFSIADFDRIIKLSQAGRIVLWLSASPEEFAQFSYLEKLFEGAKIAYVPWNMDGIAELEEWQKFEGFDNYVEKLTERPDIRKEIQRAAQRHYEDVSVTEVSILMPLQDLNLFGMVKMKNAALRLLRRSPSKALPYIHTIRRLMFNPIRYGRDITHAWSRDKLLEPGLDLDIRLPLNGISFPQDFGALLEEKIALPFPRTWDSLAWSEEHLDLQLIRKTIQALDAEIKKGPVTSDITENYRALISETWDRKISSSERSQSVSFWTTTLAIGSAGAIASGPLTGVLAGLGFAGLSNVAAKPISAGISKMLNRNSFHIWELGQKGLPRR